VRTSCAKERTLIKSSFGVVFVRQHALLSISLGVAQIITRSRTTFDLSWLHMGSMR
jgi:hypothetical protein